MDQQVGVGHGGAVLRRVVAGQVAAVALAMALATPAAWARAEAGPAAAPVDLAKHLKRDEFLSVKISPTGEYYAVQMNLPDREALAIMRRSDRKLVAKVQGVEHSEIGGYWWVNDERVMVAMAERLFGERDEPYLTGELHAINVDNTGFKTLVSNEPEEREGAVSIDLVGKHWLRGELVATLPDKPRHALVAISPMSADPLSRVEKLDLYTGRGTPVARAPVGRAEFVVDPAGNVRFALGYTAQNASRLYYRDGAAGDWMLLNDHLESDRIETPLGFSADGRTAYLQVSQPNGPDAVVAFAPPNGPRRELVRDPVVDPDRIIRGFDGRSVAGLRFEGPNPRTVFFDEQSEEAKLQRALEKVFAGLAVDITSRTRDGRLLVIHVSGDRNPGDYYLFDRETKRADGIFSRYGWLEPEQLAPTRAIALKARDGLALHGFLTTPKGREGPLPMVVLPHGGPFGIYDAAEYDPEVQMLAEAGYAVLRVNYRGSGNHGRAFMIAGAKQWGRAMQDDLTDATRWAVEQKLAVGDRICIVGASYGAYAAMMGLAREPTLYRCGVGYVGVYDLPLMLRGASRSARWARDWSEDWVGRKDEVAAVSPVGMGAAIKAPVLLAAGGRDERAPIEHSKRLEKAVKAAGGSVQTLYYPTEGHGFYTEAHRLEYYRTLLAFLATHLGGAPAASTAP